MCRIDLFDSLFSSNTKPLLYRGKGNDVGYVLCKEPALLHLAAPEADNTEMIVMQIT